ncbi:MAG: glycerophosphodiester phosphodiesterase family protein [Dehalococcoidia bacterium]
MESNNQQNNDLISIKPSYWGWLWFLVPWIVVIIVYPLISGDVAILESPLIIFALIVVVPRIISTYRTKYSITLNQIEIIQGSLLGSQRYEIPITKITRVESKVGMFGKTLGYTTLLLDTIEYNIVPLNYVPLNSDFLKEVESKFNGFTSDIQTSKENNQLPNEFGSIAHRGYSSKAPENTFAAFDSAIKNNFNFIETDVQLTADNIPVIIHDDKVDRTSNGKGLVREMKLNEIKSLDFGSWFNKEFKDEKIPTLSELLKKYSNQIHLVLELKSDQSNLTNQVSALIENENWDKIAGNPMSQIPGLTIISFHLEQVLRSIELLPVVRHGWLVGELTDTDIDIASKLGIQGIFPYAKMTSEHSVKYAKEKGLFVGVWGIENPEDVVMLRKIGVSAVTSDWPDKINDHISDVSTDGKNTDVSTEGKNS